MVHSTVEHNIAMRKTNCQIHNNIDDFTNAVLKEQRQKKVQMYILFV